MTKTITRDPDLDLTGSQINEIVLKAQRNVEAARAELGHAQDVVRNGAGAAKYTAAKLAELKAEAEHAELLVPAAEKRVAEIADKQQAAYRDAVRARIKAEAADELRVGEQLVGKLDAFEQALSDLCASVQLHNETVQRWATEMRNISDGPDGIGDVAQLLSGYRSLHAADLVGAVVHRVFQAYPRPFREYDGKELVARDLTHFSPSHGDPRQGRPINLRAVIRASTGLPENG